MGLKLSFGLQLSHDEEVTGLNIFCESFKLSKDIDALSSKQSHDITTTQYMVGAAEGQDLGSNSESVSSIPTGALKKKSF